MSVILATMTDEEAPSHGQGLARKDFIPRDGLYPLSFDSSSPTPDAKDYLHDPAIRLVADFFREKGLSTLKAEDRLEEWYPDWIALQKKHGLYAGLLSPRAYSTRGAHLDLRRLSRFIEAFAYFSPAHAYSLHVSFLGLFPILMSANEPLKREAIAALEAGGLFAFGVSERAHGSDLLSYEFTMRANGDNDFVANGSKYYIGNANAAAIISVLGRRADGGPAARTRRAPFALLALRPTTSPAYRNVRKIRTLGIRTAFVGSFDVVDHPVAAGDVISEGREAWDAMLGTIDFGKFFLGFGAVGIAGHAFAEAYSHLTKRVLYGKPVIDLAHIRRTTVIAFARLVGMKLYAYRALDYLQASGPDDRRYLLFNAVQKAKVSTEGVKVLAMMSECIGARGFESETYFETALREAPMIPSLEGSTHINFALTAQFIDAYFADPADGPAPAPMGGSEENPYWLGPRDRHTKTVRFAPYLAAYTSLRGLPNVRVFVRQVTAFRRLFVGGELPAPVLTADVGLLMAVGRCFATVVYGQLVAEHAAAAGMDEATVAMIFHGLVEDLGGEALQLAALFPTGSAQRALLRRVVKVPRTTTADLEGGFAVLAGRYPA